MRILPIIAVVSVAVLSAHPAAIAAPPASEVDQVVAAMFAHAPAEWKPRVVQDETQRLCSERRNEPTAAEAKIIQTREQNTVVFPPGGKVLGDWKRGEAIAQNGRGGQFSDEPGTVSGGNCYACHQIDPKEISYGTIGPSLSGYGKLRDFTAEASRDAYAKVFNPQGVLACSTMPRFGHNKVLDTQQIMDVTAYLMSPDSPVNK